jgi:hypothetical protein
MDQRVARVLQGVAAAESYVESYAEAAMDARTPIDLANALAEMRMWDLTARVGRNSLRLAA